MSGKPIVNRERQMVSFEEEISWPEGSPDEIIQSMNAYKERYKDCKDLCIQWQQTGYEDYHYEIVGLRPETDIAMTIRIFEEEQSVLEWEKQQAHEKRQRLEQEAAKERKKKAQEEKERQEYERLKAKFEGN